MNKTGRKILISDIHGCARTFERLLNKLALKNEDHLFLLGDYIDRGPDSKGVLDLVEALKGKPYFKTALMGNHEALLISDHHAETVKGWHDMGDQELLDSFGIPNLKELPHKYIEQCNALPFYYEDDEMVLVHAGINFKSIPPLLDSKSLMWIRDWYQDLDRAWLGNRLIVHGHTPRTRYEIEAQFAELDKLPILNIDCGCCFVEGKAHGLGYLCAFDFTNRKLIFEENCE